MSRSTWPLARGGSASQARLDLFRSVCGAVQYAHEQLIVHRDLKPANILVSSDGHAKLLDFGIAKLLAEATDSDSPLTQTGVLPMTAAYASPEQLTGSPVGVASDIYSLGVILYELTTGARPFEGMASRPRSRRPPSGLRHSPAGR